MKKFLILTLSILATLCFCIGCGGEQTDGGKTDGGHTHQYENSYCTICFERDHDCQYVNGFCLTCNEKKPSEGLSFNAVDGGYEASELGDFTGSELIIPSTYMKKPVVGVASNFAPYSNSLISVDFPATVKYIGEMAFFGSSSIETITFAENSKLEVIDIKAFWQCIALENLSLPDSLTTLKESAFDGCTSIKYFKFP